MLKLAGEGLIAEHIETLEYTPGLKDSWDLEAATRSVINTGEATGIANADYSAVLTLPAPFDSRLSVLRIAARLAVTIDSITAGQLNCRVYVDAQDANHRLFDLSWTTPGAKLAGVDTHSGNLAAIFNLLKDGAAHTFYFFFWVNAGDSVISLCRLCEGVGSADTSYWGQEVLTVTHTGLLSVSSRIVREGTGTLSHMLTEKGAGVGQTGFLTGDISNTGIYGYGNTTCLVKNGVSIRCGGSVVTDVNYVYGCNFVLRSEQ